MEEERQREMCGREDKNTVRDSSRGTSSSSSKFEKKVLRAGRGSRRGLKTWSDFSTEPARRRGNREPRSSTAPWKTRTV